MLFADRVKETTTTTGTGTVNLAGTSSGYRTFVSGIGTGKTCYYSINHQTANEWEVGIGTVTSGSPDTLSRTTTLSSSNSGSAVTFSSGTKTCLCVVPAGRMFDVALSKSVPPTVSDDNTAGYFQGCRWIDTTNGHEYVCMSNGTGTAAWALTTLNGPTSSTDTAVPTWNGTGSRLLRNSGVLIDSNDKMKTISSYSPIITATDGATVTFNLNLGNKQQVTLGGNRTLALSNETTGQAFALRVLQDGTGSRTVTWFSTIRWVAGTTPTLTTTASKLDWFGFICTGSGTYDGFILGQNL